MKRSATAPARIVKATRSWIGTPYHDQASVRGVGCDCLGLLRGAFEGLAATRDLGALAPHGVIGVLACVGFGFFMTLVTQSSSAAIAITLSAASGGMVALEAAAATVIGANLGTTSTAALAVIGATPNARRVAAATG